ncbi:hypothetical protein BJX63DRAFT_441495 [Aspergillus granulosus]|uniref:DUF7962 domain-containing protein n=1 Tax=Aspergillus granulosus TaxID=176169 RepID=A0ABR4GSS5_9EURO
MDSVVRRLELSSREPELQCDGHLLKYCQSSAFPRGSKDRRLNQLAIGRDVYLDSPMNLQRLERLEVEKPSFASQATPEQSRVERLLALYTLDTDRVDTVGGGPNLNFADLVQATRPDQIVAVENAIEFLETTLLVDGQQWLANTEAPSLADIESLCSLSWLFSTPGAVPEEHISAQLFPKVFVEVDRFEKAVATAEKSLQKINTLSGEQVAELLGKFALDHTADVIEENDPLVVQSWPTSSGSRHKTVGKLVGLTSKEITIETTEGEVSVRVHAPRKGFHVNALGPERASLS